MTTTRLNIGITSIQTLQKMECTSEVPFYLLVVTRKYRSSKMGFSYATRKRLCTHLIVVYVTLASFPSGRKCI